MTVYKVAFNKGDFALSIKYHQGRDDYQIDTNEEARKSFIDSVEDLRCAIRDYLELDGKWGISIKSITFGKNKKTFSVITFRTGVFPEISVKVSGKLKDIGEKELEPESTRVFLQEKIEALEVEVEKFVNGERAQQTLKFDESGEVEMHEEESIDNFLEDFTAGNDQ